MSQEICSSPKYFGICRRTNQLRTGGLEKLLKCAYVIYGWSLRHPVDRMVSWFYYQRWKDRPDDRNPVEVCAKNTKWTSFCGQMEAIRQRDLDQKNQEW